MAQRRNLQRRWTILIGASLMGFAMYVPMLSIPPVIHIIAGELFLSNAQVGLIFSAPLITLAILAIPSGTLADKIGIKRAAGFGIIVIIVGSLLRGTATNFITLLAFTIVYGAGWGLVYPNLPKLVGVWFPSERIGTATGIYTTVICIGCALALGITLPVVYPITNTIQGVFYVWTIPAIVAGILWWIKVDEPPRRSTEAKRTGNSRRSSYKIWTNINLWLLAGLFFISNYAMYTWTGWAPQLMTTKGASSELAALMTSAIFWACTPTMFIVPWVSDKIGLRKPFVWASFILLFIASLSVIYVPLSLGWPIIVGAGLGLGVSFVMILTLLPEMVSVEAVGRASGMVISIGYIGGLVGPWLAGYILDITKALDLHLIILSGLSIIGVGLTFRIPETGHKYRINK